MEKIDTIILAGGLGTRLRTVIDDRPKVLAPVNNRPFLDIILRSLDQCKIIGRVILAVSYMAEKIMDEYRENQPYHFSIDFSVEETPLGTGGGIRKALSLSSTEQILVLNGDSYVDVDLSELCKFHMENRAAATMTLVEMGDASRFGHVVLGDENRIRSFEEKGAGKKAGYINAGVYLFQRDLFNTISTDRACSLERDLFPVFIRNRVLGFVTKGKFIDMGTPQSYKEASFLFTRL